MNAIVLAADRGPDDALARAAGVASKSLVPAGGVAMLERVVRALEASRWVAHILILHNVDDLAASLPFLGPWLRSGKVRLAPARATPSLSVRHGIDVLDGALPVLITTSDHALLTTAMVDHFCSACAASGADICAGLTAAETIRVAYPQSRRTYLKFRDGGYSGSNLFAVTTEAGRAAIDFWARVEAERKRPWRIARAFGCGLLAGYLVRAWPLAAAVEKVGRRIGVTAAPVVMPFAEAAIDVDTPADLALVEEVLGAAGQR